MNELWHLFTYLLGTGSLDHHLRKADKSRKIQVATQLGVNKITASVNSMEEKSILFLGHLVTKLYRQLYKEEVGHFTEVTGKSPLRFLKQLSLVGNVANFIKQPLK